MYEYGKGSCDGHITTDEERLRDEYEPSDYDGYWEPLDKGEIDEEVSTESAD